MSAGKDDESDHVLVVTSSYYRSVRQKVEFDTGTSLKGGHALCVSARYTLNVWTGSRICAAT